MKINPKKIIVIFLILIIILISLLLLMQKVKETEQKFEYIYSDSMNDGTFSPKMIHLVIAAYEGDVNPKAITKATYNFITDLIPKYINIDNDESEIQKYFERNKEAIYLLVGIDNQDDFKNLMQEINKLSYNSEFEKAEFDRETIKKNINNLTVTLKIKYANQEEISINMRINNSVSSSKPAIKFYK